MHITIHKRALLEPLTQVNKAINTRNPWPIMTGIFMAASKSGLRLVGTDTAFTICRTVPEEEVNVTRLGSAVLPATKLISIIDSLPSTDITINMKNKVAEISAAGKKITLAGFDPDEYTYKQEKGDVAFQVSGDDLKSMIKRTAFAALQKADQTTPVTNIRFKTGDGRFSLTATDRHRGARASIPIESDHATEVMIAVPQMQKTADQFSGSDVVSISMTANQVVFSGDGVTVYARIVEGTFPNLDALFEIKSITDIKVHKDDLINAAKLVTITSEESKVNVEISESEVHLFGKGLDGRADDVLKPIKFSGEALRIAFNGKILQEALKALDGEEVRIRFSGKLSASVLSGDDPETAAHIIMPLRTKEEDWE